MLEIGSGANPTLSPAQLEAGGLRYTTNDLSAGELAKAGSAYDTLLLDMATASPAELPRDAFDLVFSRMVNEHVADGERYYRNIFDVLRPGGLTAHCFSTLYALPFVVNRLLPERLAGRLLDARQPARPLPARQVPRALQLEPRAEPAHDRAAVGAGLRDRRVPRLLRTPVLQPRRRCGPCARWRRPRRGGCAAVPIAALTSYAVVILRKPR